jgi:hypothetical protein
MMEEFEAFGDLGGSEERAARRASKRVKPGDGRALKPFRWWHLLTRSLLGVRVANGDGSESVYAVDVNHLGDKDSGEVMANLYRDGRLEAVSRTPAAFSVPGGTIEVATSSFGLKRCHLVALDGSERQLTPDPGSAEGRRARLDTTHPRVSRSIGAVAVAVLVVSVGLLVPQLLEVVTSVPLIAENVGTFVSPVELPVWLNTALTVGALLASTERALRLRYHWLLDGAGN